MQPSSAAVRPARSCHVGPGFLRALGAIALLAGVALASDVELKNDSIQSFSQVALQAGFVEGETGAAVLSAQAAQYPVTLKELRVWVDKNSGAAPSTMTVKLRVWNTSSASGSSPSLGSAVYTSPALGFTAGAFNAWDVSSANIVMNGPFLVGCEIVDNTYIGLLQGNQPNLVTDSNGCQGTRNFVYAKQLNGSFLWQGLCGFGVAGDLAIRALVSTGTGTGQFIDLGDNLAGSYMPLLNGSGSLAAGASFTLDFSGLPPGTSGPLFVGISLLSAPFKGGTLGPAPILSLAIPTITGALNLPASMPAGLPSNFPLYLQAWFPDAGGAQGADATNVLELLTP